MYPHLNARSGTVIATKIRTRAVGTFSTTSQTFHSAHGDDGGSRPFSSCFHKFLGFIIHDFHVAFALIHSFPTTDATTLSHYLPLSNPPISCERAVGTLSTVTFLFPCPQSKIANQKKFLTLNPQPFCRSPRVNIQSYHQHGTSKRGHRHELFLNVRVCNSGSLSAFCDLRVRDSG